jgi:hypothetical protein
VGNVGDFYLDTTNYLLYGPKTASGWTSGLLLQGNANVKTYVFSLTASQWDGGDNLGDNNVFREFVLPASYTGGTAIPAFFENGGVVVGYAEPTGLTQWMELPYAYSESYLLITGQPAVIGIRIQFLLETGAMALSASAEGYDNTLIPAGNIPATINFQVSLVEGTLGTSITQHTVDISTRGTFNALVKQEASGAARNQ